MNIHITKVRSNIQSEGGEVWEVELEPLTLLSGPPESGKSRIIRAIELGLTGRASDILYREGAATPALLQSIVPGGVKRVFAELTFSDGQKALWEMKFDRNGRAKKPTLNAPAWLDLDLACPIQFVKEQIRGSADKAAQFLLRAVGSRLSWDKVMEGIPAPHVPIINHMLRIMGVDEVLDPVALLDEVRAGVGKLKGEKAADRRSYERQLSEMGAVREVSEEEVAEAAKAASADRYPLKAAWNHLVKGRAELTAAQARLDEAEEVLARPIPTPPQGATDAEVMGYAIKVAAACTSMASDGETRCIACGTDVRAADLVEWKHEVQQALDAVVKESKLALKLFRSAKEAREEAHSQKAMASRDIARITKDLRESISTLAAAGIVPDSPPEWLVGDSADDSKSAVEYLRDLQAMRSDWERSLDIRDKLAKATESEARLAAAEVALKQRAREVLQSSVTALEAAVGEFLFDGESAVVQIPEGRGDPLMVGRKKDEVVHWGLTGSVGERMLFALASTVAKHAPFAVLLQEDRSMNIPTTVRFANSMVGTPCQVILQSTHPAESLLESPEELHIQVGVLDLGD